MDAKQMYEQAINDLRNIIGGGFGPNARDWQVKAMEIAKLAREISLIDHDEIMAKMVGR
jgi:hypothetical protein